MQEGRLKATGLFMHSLKLSEGALDPLDRPDNMREVPRGYRNSPVSDNHAVRVALAIVREI
tara:strand:+ start:32617 stop:32799 length:183 start_codon:yes stop_codon:yes gene_type:complete